MRNSLLVFSVIVIGIFACRPCEPSITTGVDLTGIPYNPTAHVMPLIKGLPPMEIPADNPMTAEGIHLGRHLFYDPILSLDSTISCASCHKQEKAFTDGTALSTGINGSVSRRSSMSLINVGYNKIGNRPNNFMWDGRFKTLEELSINGPLLDPVEMANTWENLEASLKAHPTYPELFRKAFGINNSEEISIVMVGKALAQFQRTLNSANADYDKHVWQSGHSMSANAVQGLDLFLGDANGLPSSKDAECGHCHSFSTNKALFARNQFSNNGIDSIVDLTDFLDYGLGGVTSDNNNNGMFREVSLRNIALTAPYMHDGRFQTLEEVVDHYVHGAHPGIPHIATDLSSATSLPYLIQAEKEDIIAFLHALTDTSYIHKEEWSNPFE